MRRFAIKLRALPAQRDLIDRAAQTLGKRRSDFVLEAACENARAVLLEQVQFSPDNIKFRELTALLDGPMPANAGSWRLMAVKAPWR